MLMVTVFMLAGCATMSGTAGVAGFTPLKGDSEKISFVENSASLDDYKNSKTQLDELAKILNKDPGYTRIRVMGYCSQTEINNKNVDGDVCNARADAIKGYLEEKDVAKQQIQIIKNKHDTAGIKGTFALITVYAR